MTAVSITMWFTTSIFRINMYLLITYVKTLHRTTHLATRCYNLCFWNPFVNMNNFDTFDLLFVALPLQLTVNLAPADRPAVAALSDLCGMIGFSFGVASGIGCSG